MQLEMNLPAARAARDVGMAAALDKADRDVPEWSEVAMEGIRLFAMTHKEFVAEEFRQWWLARGGVQPSSSNAWGGLFVSAVKRKIIKPTGEFRQAKSKATHAHRVSVYRKA